MNMPAAYTVLRPHAEIVTEFARKRSRFLTVMRRADSAEAAQELVDELRREHHSARHHCSAWALGPDRHIQRANDDGEPSGTAGAPMLEALSKAEMPSGAADLSDAVVVVVRWFGGTLLGAGGLVGAYSDSVVNAVEHAQRDSLLILRRRMRTFSLEAPVTEAGRWENELRGAETPSAGITVLGADYVGRPGSAMLSLAVPDSDEPLDRLTAQVAALSAGQATLQDCGTGWVDAPG